MPVSDLPIRPALWVPHRVGWVFCRFLATPAQFSLYISGVGDFILLSAQPLAIWDASERLSDETGVWGGGHGWEVWRWSEWGYHVGDKMGRCGA